MGVRPTKIRLENFCSYESTDWLKFDDKITLVGENNAGKSNLLLAFDAFFAFGSTTSHDQSDYHYGNVDSPIVIDICFTDLDDNVCEVFEPYIFDGELVIRAELPFDLELNTADTKQYYGQKEVLAHDDLRDVASLDPDNAVKLYYNYTELLEPFKNEETWKSESRASVERVVEAYRDSDQAETKKAWSKLSKTDLKEHAPDFSYFPSERSIDDATRTTNKTSLLSQLLRDAIDEIPDNEIEAVEESLAGIQSQLNGQDKFDPIKQLEQDIGDKLSSQIYDLNQISIDAEAPDLETLLIRNAQVRVNDANESLIDEMGSGSQMSFVLACLWELSERDTDSIVFALEEPENDLHPHAQRQLYQTLNRLTEKGHTILLSTHSPELVTLKDIENVVRIEKRNGKSRMCTTDSNSFSDEKKSKLRTIMTSDKNEIFFSRGILICEGPSERQTVPILNRTLARYNDDVDTFDARGVSVVDVGGKENMPLFAKVANTFNIPSIAVLDDDREEDPENPSTNERHEEIMDELEKRATEFIHLENDLEYALFKSLSVEEFCASMDAVSSFGHNTEDLSTEIREAGKPKEDVFEAWFSRFEPSKPQFGRAAVEQIQEDRVPERVAKAIEQALLIAE